MKEKQQTLRQATIDGRHSLFLQLINDKGLTVKEAGQLLGYTEQSAYHLSSKLRKQGKEVSRSIPDQLLRKMNRRAKHLLDGKAFGDMKEVRCSTVANLIAEGWKRQYPVKQEAPTGNQFNYTQVNISQYQLDDGSRYGVPAGNKEGCQNTAIDVTEES